MLPSLEVKGQLQNSRAGDDSDFDGLLKATLQKLCLPQFIPHWEQLHLFVFPGVFPLTLYAIRSKIEHKSEHTIQFSLKYLCCKSPSYMLLYH